MTDINFSMFGGSGSGVSVAAAAGSGAPASDWNSTYTPPTMAPKVSSHARTGTTGFGGPDGATASSSKGSGRAVPPGVAARGAYAAGLSEVNFSMGTRVVLLASD